MNCVVRYPALYVHLIETYCTCVVIGRVIWETRGWYIFKRLIFEIKRFRQKSYVLSHLESRQLIGARLPLWDDKALPWGVSDIELADATRRDAARPRELNSVATTMGQSLSLSLSPLMMENDATGVCGPACSARYDEIRFDGVSASTRSLACSLASCRQFLLGWNLASLRRGH